MSEFLKDAPFKGSRGVYFVIKLVVLVLALLLALHVVFWVV
jgi:Tfp pilus assembly protein PilX